MLKYDEQTRTLRLSRREVLDLLLMLDAWTDESQWQVLHDKITDQLVTQDDNSYVKGDD